MKLFKKYTLFKKGALSIPMVVVTFSLLLVFLVIGLTFSGQFINRTKQSTSIEACRMSMILNAHIRGVIDARFWESSKERIPINCPQRPELEIKYRDISSNVRTDEGRKMNILKTISDEMVITHYKTIGDLPNSEPFANQDGIYCIIDRKITFDDAIRKNNNLRYIDNFLTFQINTKSHPNSMAAGKYYSEYLYGYKKDENMGRVNYNNLITNFVESDTYTQKVREIGEETFSSIKYNDLIIDTTKDYYSMRIIFKGRSLNQKFADSGVTEAGVGMTALCALGAVTLFASSVLIPPAAILGAKTSLICIGLGSATAGTYQIGTYNNDKKAYFAITSIYPVDSIDQLGCNQIY
jgi:hypothetical protein